MELSRDHREALIEQLKESRNKLSTVKDNLMHSKNETLIPSREMKKFLLENQVELIEKSLIENDIDF